MSVTNAFLAEFENEAKTTRRVLERVPTDKLAWKPHPKSMSLGTLAQHVAMSPGVICGWALEDVTGGSGQRIAAESEVHGRNRGRARQERDEGEGHPVEDVGRRSRVQDVGGETEGRR